MPYAPCPRCHHVEAERVKFTLWGGALGPKLLNHVKCLQCGAKYNGETGNSNTTGIAIYTAVAMLGSLILVALLFIVLNR
jgi:hypothetical protein